MISKSKWISTAKDTNPSYPSMLHSTALFKKGYMVTFHWSDVTTGEVGSMVREAIKRGEQVMAEEVKANGEIHQNAK